MATHPSNIGVLQKLPPEIRLDIWEYLRPKGHVPSYVAALLINPEGNLGILRTCRQLYDEVASFLYKGEVLTFHISRKYPSEWLRINSRYGAVWFIWNYNDGKTRGFQRLPYDKIGEVNIEIEAPDAKDLGQLKWVWEKVRKLVLFLSEREQFMEPRQSTYPKVRINLKAGETPWIKDDRTVHSIPAHTRNDLNIMLKLKKLARPDRNYDANIAAILLEFCRLRNVQNPDMWAPIPSWVSHAKFLENVKMHMSRNTPWCTTVEDEEIYCQMKHQSSR